MEENDLNLMTNKELIELYKNFDKKYKEKQHNLKTIYTEMLSISEQAKKIKDIVSKRGGKIE